MKSECLYIHEDCVQWLMIVCRFIHLNCIIDNIIALSLFRAQVILVHKINWEFFLLMWFFFLLLFFVPCCEEVEGNKKVHDLESKKKKNYLVNLIIWKHLLNNKTMGFALRQFVYLNAVVSREIDYHLFDNEI